MSNIEENIPVMTKGRLIEINENRSTSSSADVIEILAAMFLSQSQANRANKQREENILSEISGIKKRLRLLEQYAGSPVYQTVLYDEETFICDKCGSKLEN